MDRDRLLEWIEDEIAKIKLHMGGVHTEKMIYHGSLVQMETLRDLIINGYFD